MEKIAIIGVSCLFPGAQTPDHYWQNLLEGKDTTSLVTAEHMGVDPDVFFSPKKGIHDAYYCKRGGFIRNFRFDPSGYRIPATDLDGLDDLFKWSLHVAKEALTDSGYVSCESALSRCGLVLGNLSFPTRKTRRMFARLYRNALQPELQKWLANETFELTPLSGSEGEIDPRNALISGYPPAVVAEALALGGAAFAIDAACASSLYAVDLACCYLQSHSADLMLAGAVSCADPLFIHLGFSIFQAYPENGQSRPLDKTSTGLIAAEGAGMFVLKRYSDARRDKDDIYAVIEGIGLSNDGRGKSVLNPNARGQILSFERAYAHVDPESIDYVECHATGTPAGDPVELDAMASFWHGKKFPLIGAVKSNLGHMLSSAGMGSMLKVILSMQRGTIPPTLHINDPQQAHNVGPDHIVTSLIPWPDKGTVRRAGISAFGFGGTNAHLILSRESDVSLATPAQIESPPALAIIGMDAHFGDFKNLDTFGHAIYHGQQHLRPLPARRWKGIESTAPLPNGKTPEGAYIETIDIDFLNIKTPPAETDQLIPQHLLMLQTADRAIKDAGLKPGGRIGVIIAMGTELAIHAVLGRMDLTWQIRESLKKAGIVLGETQIAELEAIAKDSLQKPAQANQYTSFIGNLMAGRIAALWDFSGPAFTLSAEETSVPRALEVAQMLLWREDLDAIVLGAIDLAGSPEHMLARSRLSPLNTGKHTLSYDLEVNGWTIGEGAGAIVLKRLDSARRHQNRIYATIDAISLVRTASTPLAQSVSKACRHAWKQAVITPSDIGYLEVSASGIATEDRAEIDGLTQSYSAAGTALSCALGSVKTNIGHAFSASGMAALIKTAHCLHHRYLPGTPHWSAPKTPWENTPFFVPPQSQPWFTHPTTPRRIAAINTLSADGTAAHIILSEAPERTHPISAHTLRPAVCLFPIAGHTQQYLLDQLEALEKTLPSCTDIQNAAHRCFHIYQNRADRPFALGLVADTLENLRREIQAAHTGITRAFETGKSWTSRQGSACTPNPLGTTRKIAFVYPGSASTYIGMGQALWQYFPRAVDSLSQLSLTVGECMCDHLLYPRSLQALSAGQLKQREIELTENTASLFQVGVGYAALLTRIIQDEFQIQPHMAFGYSLGESSMLFALGVWRDTDRITKAMAASPVLTEHLFGPKTAVHQAWDLPPTASISWHTFVLRATAEEVTACLSTENRTYLTMINAPDEVVISGDAAGCQRVIRKLGCTAFRMPFNSALHCDVAKICLDAFVDWHTLPAREVPQIVFYSGRDCAPLRQDTRSLARSIGNNISNRVDFPRTVNQVYRDGAGIFIDLGPRGIAASWIRRTLDNRPHLAIAIDRKSKDNFHALIQSLAQLVSHRVPMDLSELYVLPASPVQNAKSLIKPITLGGQRIEDAFCTPKNRPLVTALHRDKKPPLPPTPEPQATQPTRPTPAIRTSGQDGFPDQTRTYARTRLSQSHAAFLTLRTESLRQLGEMITRQTKILAICAPITKRAAIWDEADLITFARGDIASVFGPDYAIIDTYARRVRLPMPPYLLVSRVTHMKAERGLFKPSAMTTEYDIPHNAWYSVDGQAPLAIAVESGQCDLLLISYLGIDFECKGHRVYRLLDCTLTFMGDLPMNGDTLRYDIRINSFSRSGDSLLFFFSYECFVKDKRILKMDGGCAGFFSDEELAQGKGVIFTEKERAEKSALKKAFFDPPLICDKTAFDREDLLHLTRGDLSACFGEHHGQNGRNPSLRLPPETMLMIDRIASVDPAGGPCGLGLVIAEKDLAPDHWYFPCHFKDDQVMAGSLIGEACAQVMQFYMLYLGLHTHTNDARFQPVTNLSQTVRCRGQVVPSDTRLIYRMEILKIGLSPYPYAIADVSVILDGKTVAYFKNLGLQISEKQRD